ncbi:hypothetical protein [Naumannella huperziae]
MSQWGQPGQPYGQPQQPQPPYGQQPQQPQQPYGQQPGFAPQQAPYAGPPPAQAQWGAMPQPPGPGQAPPRTRGNSPLKIIGIIVGALVLIAILGGAVSSFTGGSRNAGAPSVPVPPPPATTDPPPSGPGTGGGGGGGNEPSGDAVEVGDGVTVQPPPGWRVEERGANSVVLSDGTSVYVAQAGAGTGAGAEATLRSYFDQLAAEGTEADREGPTRTEVDPALDVASGSMTVTMASGGGSQTVGIVAFVSVRTEDDQTVIGSMIFDAANAPDSDEMTQSFGAMSSSMMRSQLGG